MISKQTIAPCARFLSHFSERLPCIKQAFNENNGRKATRVSEARTVGAGRRALGAHRSQL
jgi:hypothetical protein